MVPWTTMMIMMMVMVTTTAVASSSPGCPVSCACKWKNGKQTVECVNKKVTGITASLGIDPATQVLDISDNDLSAAGLPRDTFAAADLFNLQRIHAARCNVYYVHDQAFRGLTNLVDLDLSGNCVRHVPTAAFAECPSLMKLSLSGNPIGSVLSRAFRHLSQLTALDLSDCGLTAVEAGAFDGLFGLDWLKLDNNRLTHVPGQHTFPNRLHGVELQHNNWQCDCRMADMHRWLILSRVPVTEEPVCSGPSVYENVPVRRMRTDELACAPVMYADTRPVQDVTEGVNVSFRCLVAATPLATVEWLFGGTPVYRHNSSELVTVDGNMTAELYVYNASLGDSGAYACVAENQAGSARTNFTVMVRPKRPSSATGPAVDDRSAPSQSSSAAANGEDRSLLYVACLAAGSVALSTVVAVVVAVRCRRSKRAGGRAAESTTSDKRRPIAPVADGYRTVSMASDKEPMIAAKPTPAQTMAASVTTTETVVASTAMSAVAVSMADEATGSNPDVVSDAKRAGWEIDFEQIVWAECPPATGYVSIQIPVQCGIECLGAYYATAAVAETMATGGCTGTVRRQHRRAAVLAAYDDTVQVRTTMQGGYPLTVAPTTTANAAHQTPPTIVIGDDDADGSIVVAPIISPPLPFRSATLVVCDDDVDDSIAL